MSMPEKSPEPAHDVKAAPTTLDKLAHEEGERSKLDLVKLDNCTAKQDESAVEASMKQGRRAWSEWHADDIHQRGAHLRCAAGIRALDR